MNDVDSLLKKGIAAVKSGQCTKARALLQEVVRQRPDDVTAWLWLSGAVGTDEERRICLENVLAINPNNGIARRGLEQLNSAKGITLPKVSKSSLNQLDRTFSEQSTQSSNSVVHSEGIPSEERGVLCPFCRERLKGYVIRCPHCTTVLSLVVRSFLAQKARLG